MKCSKLIFWFVFGVCWFDGNCDQIQHQSNTEPEKPRNNGNMGYSLLSRSMSKVVEDSHESCYVDDFDCLFGASNDKPGLEAIRALHQQLDDDANGDIDLTETGDFLRQDLKIDSGYEKRQKAFHQNDDMHISVKELWESWLRSEVHNWTVQQTVEWLSVCVDLPQYVPNFIQNKVTGAALPRLAVNNMNYLSSLGIKDPIHKQKISLKAMDVVLFGPPKDGHNSWKDFVVILLIIGGGIGFWYGYQQNKHFKKNITRMCTEMETLQNAETALRKLQKELEEARQAQEHVTSEKQNLERRLQESEADPNSLHHSNSDGEVSQLKQEIEMLRNELLIAESKLQQAPCWSPPVGLQQWLQLTHETENKAYVKKKMQAEKQLQHAREACEKLRKKRSSFVGAFVSTHGKSIDDVDRTIVEARTALNEVTQELQERVHRWKQIESLCGFNIIHNNGLQSLETALYKGLNGRAFGLLRNRISSQDDLDDETSSVYTSTPALTGLKIFHL
ncbi:stromal interaction molecule homolog isoform X2 [Onthophagus taurus]|uniref:stromal interaction molecule homolog isoform X2 n=1 Tax=Onthophagus taurus TaxID=166361 RepID=UPI0039BEA190